MEIYFSSDAADYQGEDECCVFRKGGAKITAARWYGSDEPPGPDFLMRLVVTQEGDFDPYASFDCGPQKTVVENLLADYLQEAPWKVESGAAFAAELGLDRLTWLPCENCEGAMCPVCGGEGCVNPAVPRVCASCAGKGWAVLGGEEDGEPALVIRCETCRAFDTDEEARAAVAAAGEKR